MLHRSIHRFVHRFAAPFVVVFGLVSGAGCDSDDAGVPPGPFDALDLERELVAASLSGPVHVARDAYGVAHISAGSVRDAAYAQGYVMAHDRLPQMDLLRRFGAGTLGELFGAALGSVVDSDLEMRMHRMYPLAAETLAVLRASTDPTDVEIVGLLEGFAEGVNAYAQDLAAGLYSLDLAITYFDADKFMAWRPEDSLVLGRFQAFSLSYSADSELATTGLFDAAREAFFSGAADPAYAARAGFAADIAGAGQVVDVSTIEGFPNVDPDTGSRSNAKSGHKRPKVRRELIDAARHFLGRDRNSHPDPRRLRFPNAGSNAWAVSKKLTGGPALLAGDQHLDLSNPTVFYPTHLTVPGVLDIEGVTFPGIPGIILGHNGHLAWGSTVVAHDANDVYLENIVPCAQGGGDCVEFNGGEVPLETWTEEVRVGLFGTITQTKTVTYERVPHHGPILPTVDNGNLVPRSGNEALSIRYTGYEPTFELRAIFSLGKAKTIEEAFAALDHFSYGGQNWVIAQTDGRIGWTTHAKIPTRAPAAYTFDADNNPDGIAPFLVQPGDGSAEWEGWVDARYVPHSIDPDKGYLVTANSDPVGESFDNNLLNGPMVDGRPLYVGHAYAPGFRTGRITELVQQARDEGNLSRESMGRIQVDTRSNIGALLRGAVVAAVDAMDSMGPPADVVAWKAAQDPGSLDALRDAADRLAVWTLETPAAIEGSPTAAEIADSIATSIFNAWHIAYLGRLLDDELAVIEGERRDFESKTLMRIAVKALTAAHELSSGVEPGTGEAVLCDDLATASVTESCTGIALLALAEGLTVLSTELGTNDPEAWRWGALHTLTIEPLFPTSALNLPPSDDPNPHWRGGYPRPGDNFAVNRCDYGLSDFEFAQSADGPAQRFLAELDSSGVKVKLALPGGAIFNRSSSHYRDLIDRYYVQHDWFELPYRVDDIVAHGESRWRFAPVEIVAH